MEIEEPKWIAERICTLKSTICKILLGELINRSREFTITFMIVSYNPKNCWENPEVKEYE